MPWPFQLFWWSETKKNNVGQMQPSCQSNLGHKRAIYCHYLEQRIPNGFFRIPAVFTLFEEQRSNFKAKLELARFEVESMHGILDVENNHRQLRD